MAIFFKDGGGKKPLWEISVFFFCVTLLTHYFLQNMDELRCKTWFLDKYGDLEVRGVTSLRKGTCSTFTTSRIVSTKSSYLFFFQNTELGRTTTHIFLGFIFVYIYICTYIIYLFSTLVATKKNVWAPETFQPNILIIAGGNYRTGRCTDGRKVKVLAWLGTWQFFLPINGGQIVDQAMFFFAFFVGTHGLFLDILFVGNSTQRRQVPYIWCHFDAFSIWGCQSLERSSAGLRSMPCPPNAFGFAWSWGRPIEGWRRKEKTKSVADGVDSLQFLGPNFF